MTQDNDNFRSKALDGGEARYHYARRPHMKGKIIVKS